MKDSVCPSINNVNIGVGIRILAGSIRDFILWRNDLLSKMSEMGTRRVRLKQHPGDNQRTVLIKAAAVKVHVLSVI